MQDGWLVKLALLFCVWRKSAAAPPDEMRVSTIADAVAT